MNKRMNDKTPSKWVLEIFFDDAIIFFFFQLIFNEFYGGC